MNMTAGNDTITDYKQTYDTKRNRDKNKNKNSKNTFKAKAQPLSSSRR